MYSKFYSNVVSIDDTVKAAVELQEEAKMVYNRDQHAKWWDKKVELLLIINSAFETGFWIGENYDKLWSAKNIIFRAESIAGNYAR
jgi:hypothetical protein